MDRRSRNDGVATGSTSAERSNPASRPPSHHLPSSSGPGRASDPRSQQRKWSSTRHQSSYARQSRDFTWGGSYGHHWISKNDRYSLRSKRLISPRRSPSPVKNDRKSREGSYLKRRNGSYYRSRSPTRRSEPKRIKEEPLEPHSLVKEELLDMPLEVPPIVDNSPPMTTVKVEIETIAAATSNSVQCTTDGHPPIKEEPPEADKKQAVHRLVLYSSSEASSQCPLNPEEMPFSEEAENHGTMAYDDAVAESTMEEGEVLLVDELKSSVVIDPTTLAISDAIHRGFSEFLYTSLPHDEFMPVPPPTPESTRTISPVPPPSAASFHRTPPHILNLLHFGPTGCPSSPPPPSENGPSGQQAHASTSSTPHSSHRSHPSSSATHRPNQQHPKGHAKSYKLVRDMALGQEANVKRVYGRCNDNYSKYNLPPDFPMTDPRKRIFKPQQCDLPLLHFKLDDNWTGRLFRREVSIFNLNDNVNRAFLERMAEKYEVEEIAVIFNPQTSRHLGMAFLFFKRALTAEAFVDANNDKSVMGSAIRCVFDPFASQLYDCFSNVAPDCAFPKFNYLKDMSDLHLMRLRDEILGKRAVVPPPVEPLGPISPELQDSLAQARYSKAVPPGRDPRLSGYPHRHDSVDERDGRRHSLENPRVPSTSVPPPMKSPPPPYSEMLPMGHEASNLPSTSRGSDSQKRSATDEVHSRREKKPRRSSSMSSSEEEIRGRRDAGRRRKGDTTPPTDVETIKFTTSARVYSSERKPNGDKKVVEETTTTLYHRKEITRKSSRSPDSFEEEMKRREESEKRKTKKSRRNRDGQIGFHWSSNESSDSDKDGEIGRRRRGREAPRHGDGSRQRSDGGSNMSTPVKSGQSVPSTPSRRGFQAPPAGSSIPPPGLVHIPPVGVVDPVPASPHPPPQPWHPSMASAPPPLPGTYMSSTVTPVHRGGARCYEDRWGPSASSVDRWSASPGDPRIRPRSRFIRKSMSFAPPPRFDGGRRPSASTSGKSGFIPPPMWFGYGFPPPMIYPPPMGQSPMGQPPTVPLTFVTPPPPPPCTPNTAALRLLDEATKAKQFVQDLQPEKKPKLEEGSPVRHSAAATSSQQCVASPCPGSAEKKSIDDRLSSIFGLQKKALVDTSIPRNNTSAPHLAGYGTEVKMERPPSVEIRNDDMDVADSDEEKPVMMKKMTDSFSHLPPFQMEQARTASLVSDCNFTTMAAVHSTVNELQQVINNDLWKKMDMWAMEGIDEWMQQAKKEEEEKKREQIRLSMETADPTLLTPRKDIMQAILEEKLKSPEKMAFMPKLNMPKFIRVQKPVLSRENTPLERIESRGSTRSRSTLSTSSSATDEEEEESEKSSEEEDEDLIELKKRRKNRAPKMKNITSSADSSAVHSEAEEGGYAKGKDSNHFCRAGPSTPPEEEVDFDGPPEPKEEKVETPPPPVEEEEEEEEEDPLAHLEVMKAGGRQGAYHPLTHDHCYEGEKGDPALRSHPAPKDSIDLVIDDVLKVQLQEAAKASPKKPPKKNDYVPKELLNLIPTSTTIEKTFKKLVKTFAPRSNEEEDRIYRNFMAGMDGEDNDILCKVLNTMQEGGKRPFVITSKSGESRQFPDEVPFAPFIRAFTPCELARAVKVGKVDNFFDDNELEGIVPHRTGCARTEGFYRWTNRQKTRIMRRPEGASERAEITDRDEIATRHQVQACKEQRSMNRRLMTLMDSNFSSDFFKVNQLKYRKKMIKFARSKIHGWGLYALEPIAPDDMIVEYVGQKVRPIIADEREKAYEKRGIGSSYLFRIDEHEVIDATKMGNFARFINHSCQPNCYAKVVTMDGDKRIVIYSKRLIEKGEEITYDYKFPIENDKVPCLCGAPTCRGFLN